MNNTGKVKGAIARAKKLSPEERSTIASKAAIARWSGDVLNAICGSPDHPLKIGDIEIQCYVLEDETRVLSQRELQQGIGLSKSGPTSTGEHRLKNLIARISAGDLEANVKLMSSVQNPIKFRTPHGNIAYGYEATILADICDAVLVARKEGYLQKQQMHIAERCEVLVRGFARVGIIALVDEATGYQELRAKNYLASILEAFIAKELQPWVKTFPDDFYKHLFRLRDLNYPQDPIKRPQYFGILTNDMIYKRLAPGVLDELKRMTPQDDSGRPKYRYFRRLTTNLGYPKLREHLGSVVTLMKLSDDWRDFMGKLDQIHPKYDSQLPLLFQYDAEKDDGKGL